MEDEEQQEQKCEEGLPPWMATFADMMSLLLCFFVLLLSFAEIDAIRFKKMAESFKDAFGVQREILASEIVKGISIIAQNFTGASPEVVVIETIKQDTTDETQRDIQVKEATEDFGESQGQGDFEVTDEVVAAVEQQIQEEIQQQAEQLKEALAEEITEGLVTVETQDTKVIVRIQEKGSFPSGSADLNPGFLEVMGRISSEIAAMPGSIVVAGHTDNVPIHNERFRSNWELSSARAVTVVHALLENPDVDPERVQIEGHADTIPIATNDTPEGRALNRRVELIVERDKNAEVKEALNVTEAAPEASGEAPGSPAAESDSTVVEQETPSAAPAETVVEQETPAVVSQDATAEPEPTPAVPEPTAGPEPPPAVPEPAVEPEPPPAVPEPAVEPEPATAEPGTAGDEAIPEASKALLEEIRAIEAGEE